MDQNSSHLYVYMYVCFINTSIFGIGIVIWLSREIFADRNRAFNNVILISKEEKKEHRMGMCNGKYYMPEMLAHHYKAI